MSSTLIGCTPEYIFERSVLAKMRNRSFVCDKYGKTYNYGSVAQLAEAIDSKSIG